MTPSEAGRQFYLYLANELDAFLPRNGAIELAVSGPNGFPDEDIFLLAESLIVNSAVLAGPISICQIENGLIASGESSSGQIVDLRNTDDTSDIDGSVWSKENVVFLRDKHQHRLKCNTIFFDRSDGITFTTVTKAFVRLLDVLEYKKQALEMPMRYVLRGFNSILREFSILQSGGEETIDLERFSRAVSVDWRYVDRTILPTEVVNWIQQFPQNAQAGAISVLRYLNAVGYYSRCEIANILLEMLEREAPAAQLVAIQPPAKSEQMLMYEMRVSDRVKPILSALGGVSRKLVCVDDVIGSGDTIIDCLFQSGPNHTEKAVSDWLNENDNSILVLSAFASSEGIDRIERDPRCNGKVKVLAGTVLASENGVFAVESEIIPNSTVREEFRSVCESVGQSIFPGAALGWGGCAWAVVTEYNVPDCSLPAIWGNCDELDWKALFPRR